MLKAVVSVEYSDCSNIGREEFNIQEELISITPLHANMVKAEAVHEECAMLWKDMLQTLNLTLEFDKLYNTIFEVKVTWTEDYYGEIDSDWDVTLIDHEEIGKFDEDSNLVYYQSGNMSQKAANIGIKI
ncbi:hypothetical protein NVP1101O_135 [Vibrio phage 1.101.O._10N.261.45.C6]|nr:hypothetical protein NVP1101O_135 [Vibrio phage 1.101.O._10N.261.45.C6]